MTRTIERLSEEMPMTCYFCDMFLPDADSAIEALWEPSFFDEATGVEFVEPVCRECCHRCLWYDPLNYEMVRPDQDKGKAAEVLA